MGALLVFDLDGTLVDTAPDLLATLDRVLAEAGYACVPHAAARPMIGQGARRMIERALEVQAIAVPRDELEALYRRFLVHYQAHICDTSRFYPGAVDALDRFAAAGWRFAVCTNKHEAMSRLLLRTLSLEGRFAAIAGGDTFAAAKPDPRHLLATIARAGHQRHEAVMVGDGRTDVEAARAANVPIVGVSFGYTPVPMRELDPDILLDHFDQLTVVRTLRLLPDALDSARSRSLIAGTPTASGA
jgi:phosphoglycolate phosphatase